MYLDNLITISKEAQSKIDELKKSVNIVGLSGGKDSMATCILMRWLGIPFKTVTAEVWWKKDISGENPYHYEWFHSEAVPKLERWGIQCDLISSDITAYEYMTTPIKYSKYPERVGKLRGFPLCGACGIQRDCKTRPCGKYYREQNSEHNVVTGIATDEKDRLVTNAANKRESLLDILEIPEYMTFPICASEKLLSPTYTYSNRGGCWFCPNQKLYELEILYREFPHLWNELMEIQEMPNKVQEKFNRTQTLYDIEKEILNGVQTKWFMGMLVGGE